MRLSRNCYKLIQKFLIDKVGEASVSEKMQMPAFWERNNV